MPRAAHRSACRDTHAMILSRDLSHDRHVTTRPLQPIFVRKLQWLSSADCIVLYARFEYFRRDYSGPVLLLLLLLRHALLPSIWCVVVASAEPKWGRISCRHVSSAHHFHSWYQLSCAESPVCPGTVGVNSDYSSQWTCSQAVGCMHNSRR